MKACPYDLRDYLFGELKPAEAAEVERFLEHSSEARDELEKLKQTHRSLLSLPEEEIPRRIAFVSDKVFEPSLLKRWWQGMLAEGPRLAFGISLVILTVFAGLWWTQPTLTSGTEGWKLSFASTAAETVSPNPEAPGRLTEAQVREVVRDVLALQLNDQQQRWAEIAARQDQNATAVAEVRAALKQLAADSEQAYRLVDSRLDEVIYSRSARAELNPIGQ